jgi:hypothetical protein
MVFGIKRLKETAVTAALAQHEKDISCFAFALLNYAEINLMNGYEIRSYGNLIEITLHDRKVMVMRCELDDITKEVKQEFANHLKVHQFENGMIITSLETIFYSRSYAVRERNKFVTINEYLKILMEFINIKELEFEDI